MLPIYPSELSQDGYPVLCLYLPVTHACMASLLRLPLTLVCKSLGPVPLVTIIVSILPFFRVLLEYWVRRAIDSVSGKATRDVNFCAPWL